MESRTVASIKYLDASQLFGWMKYGNSTPFQVVDVRGSDYVGGHIRGVWNYPSSQFEDKVLELMARLSRERESRGADMINIVFHCAQSQQRGPSAAMRFLRKLPDDELSNVQIYVLRGGFITWQSLYGRDSTVTEGYHPDLWA